MKTMNALELREIADKFNAEKDAKARAEMLAHLDEVVYPTAKALAKIGKYSGDFVLPHASQRPWLTHDLVKELTANDISAEYNARHNLLTIKW